MFNLSSSSVRVYHASPSVDVRHLYADFPHMPHMPHMPHIHAPAVRRRASTTFVKLPPKSGGDGAPRFRALPGQGGLSPRDPQALSRLLMMFASISVAHDGSQLRAEFERCPAPAGSATLWTPLKQHKSTCAGVLCVQRENVNGGTLHLEVRSTREAFTIDLDPGDICVFRADDVEVRRDPFRVWDCDFDGWSDTVKLSLHN